jgi:hypothetical protein
VGATSSQNSFVRFDNSAGQSTASSGTDIGNLRHRIDADLAGAHEVFIFQSLGIAEAGDPLIAASVDTSVVNAPNGTDSYTMAVDLFFTTGTTGGTDQSNQGDVGTIVGTSIVTSQDNVGTFGAGIIDLSARPLGGAGALATLAGGEIAALAGQEVFLALRTELAGCSDINGTVCPSHLHQVQIDTFEIAPEPTTMVLLLALAAPVFPRRRREN